MQSRPKTTSHLVALAGLCCLAACDSPIPHRLADSAVIDSTFACTDSVRLQEPGTMTLVDPKVVVDPLGGFLVTDGRESHFYRYSRKGELLWSAGARGHGPGEFTSLFTAVRLPDGRIAALDALTSLRIWDGEGHAEESRTALGILPLYSATVVDSGAMIIVGQQRDSLKKSLTWLHRLDLQQLSLTSSFFTGLSDSISHTWDPVFGGISLALHHDTLAVVSAMMDSLYFLNVGGDRLTTVHIPFASFHRPSLRGPRGGPKSREMRQWISSFDRILAIAWPSADDIVVQASYLTDNGPVYRTLIMSPGGQPKAEFNNTPRLETGFGDTLVFQHPRAVEPNLLCLTTVHDLAARR